MVGRLIVLEGTDGAGKETQAKLLIERLRNDGYQVYSADFPQYGKPSAHFVERYLRGEFGDRHQVGAKRASYFYALDRYSASFEIRKWLEEGAIVVSNRYTSANKGHQLANLDDFSKRGEMLNWLNELEYETMGIPVPNLTILLHQKPEIGQRLVDKKAPREYTGGATRDILEKDLVHLRDAESAYLFCLEHDTKENWKRVVCFDGDEPRSREAIHGDVYSLVQNLLLKED